MSLVADPKSDPAFTPFRSRKDAALRAGIVFALMLPVCLMFLFVLAPVQVDGIFANLSDLKRDLGYGGEAGAKVEVRLFWSMLCAAIGAAYTYFLTWDKTPLTEPFRQRNDMQPHLYYGEHARLNLMSRMADRKGLRAKTGLYLAPHLPLPFSLETMNCLIVGSQGSGKSNLIRAFADQAIERGDRVILLCAKGDVAGAFTTEDSILIAAHDAEGLALDLAADVVTLGDIIQLAHDCVPPSDAPFWSDTARIVLTDLIREVIARKLEAKQTWTARDIVKAVMAPAEALRRRILNYDLSASPFLQSADPDAEDRTVMSILLTLRSGVYANLRPLAWAWNGFDASRRFSIRRWLADDYQGIRTVIVQYSAEYSALSTLVVGRVIRGIARRLSDPSLPNNPNRRVTIALDEIHLLERIEGLGAALALGREKGLVCWTGTQNYSQLRDVYGSDKFNALIGLFQMKIFGSQADAATATMIEESLKSREVIVAGAAGTAEPGKAVKKEVKSIPTFSVERLNSELGVYEPQGVVRALLHAFGQAYVLEWPLTLWNSRRDPHPAPWLSRMPMLPTPKE